VRRLDVTVDVLADGATGRALLSGIAAVDAGRLDVQTRRGARGMETVSWLGSRGLLARAYDKGVESGSHARGERTRLEAQYRWAREQRRAPEELSASYVREKFLQRFAPLWKATHGLKVVGRMQLKEKVLDLVEAGELTTAQAEQIVAFQFLSDGDRTVYNERTRRRRRQLVRETGVVLAGAGEDDVEVDLHEILGQVLETNAWDRRG
jgi:hypothetical protein